MKPERRTTPSRASATSRSTLGTSTPTANLILVTGIVWPILSRIGLGRLPGDIMFQGGGNTFYFPLVTCIIISIVLSALFWLFNR
jgi:DUF2905 family protein